MKRKFLTSLMSIVIVLVTCSFAYGESAAERKPAWLLWKYTKIITKELGKGGSSWEMVEAFPDYDRCRGGMKKYWEEAWKLQETIVVNNIMVRKDKEIPPEQRRKEVEEAFRSADSIRAYLKKRDELKEEARREMRDDKRIGGKPYETISSILFDPFRFYIIEFKCFPDTIDPRM